MKKLLLLSIFVVSIQLFISIKVVAAQIFLTDTGHYYEFFASPNITWGDANTAAATHSYLGVQGHLPTISSATENAFACFPISLNVSLSSHFEL